jgi:predicted RNA-binding protein YlxR (DUF448 family)
VPRRRCVGCGRTAPKAELLRLAVARDAGVRPARRAVLDLSATLPGRGAYLCRATDRTIPDEHCLQLAVRRDSIARTLRRSVTLDLDDRSAPLFLMTHE